MNVEIMTAEELVHWAKPTTPLEQCLQKELRLALEEINRLRTEVDSLE